MFELIPDVDSIKNDTGAIKRVIFFFLNLAKHNHAGSIFFPVQSDQSLGISPSILQSVIASKMPAIHFKSHSHCGALESSITLI